MSRSLSNTTRRTYFSNPLIEESLRFLPAALTCPTTDAFRDYLAERLPQNSRKTRERFAEYIAHRFSTDGVMNRVLAAAIDTYGDSPTGREILYFELLQAVPLLQEVASVWLSELPPEGVPRAHLLGFLTARIAGRNADRIAKDVMTAFRRCGKAQSPRPGSYVPLWTEPPQASFLYVLARLYPQREMVRVDTFAGLPVVRGMLWSRTAIDTRLKAALSEGYVSRLSELDQYRQFTLEGDGEERLRRLLGDRIGPLNPEAPVGTQMPQTTPPADRQIDLPLGSKQ